MRISQHALLALLVSCASEEVPDVEEGSAVEASQEAGSSALSAGSWEAQVIEEGSDWVAASIPIDGTRSIVWKLRVGEGIEAIRHGFIGAGGIQEQMTMDLAGETELILTLQLEAVTGEEGAGEHALRSGVMLGAVQAGEGGPPPGGLIGGAPWTASSDSLRVPMTVQSIIPGSRRNADAWSASSRTVISTVGKVGEPVILAREFWNAQEPQELRLERARLVPGDQIDVALSLNGERQDLSDYTAPAWVFFILAE